MKPWVFALLSAVLLGAGCSACRDQAQIVGQLSVRNESHEKVWNDALCLGDEDYRCGVLMPGSRKTSGFCRITLDGSIRVVWRPCVVAEENEPPYHVVSFNSAKLAQFRRATRYVEFAYLGEARWRLRLYDRWTTDKGFDPSAFLYEGQMECVPFASVKVSNGIRYLVSVKRLEIDGQYWRPFMLTGEGGDASSRMYGLGAPTIGEEIVVEWRDRAAEDWSSGFSPLKRCRFDMSEAQDVVGHARSLQLTCINTNMWMLRVYGDMAGGTNAGSRSRLLMDTTSVAEFPSRVDDNSRPSRGDSVP